MRNAKVLEILAYGLTVISFVAVCWVAHRLTESQVQCVSSPYIRFVQIESERFDNCTFENRLGLGQILRPITAEQSTVLRSLEVMDPLSELIAAGPRLAVVITYEQPHAFELGRHHVRLGRQILDDQARTRRSLAIAILQNEFPDAYPTRVQLEMVADFVMSAMFPGEKPQLVRFPYLSSADVWGMRPLLTAGLWRVFEKLPLAQKVKIMNSLATGRSLPTVPILLDTSAKGLASWYQQVLQENLRALGVEPTEESKFAFKSTIKELDVEAPTHWELSVDLTHAPGWEVILNDLKKRSRLNERERILVFTPNGTIALPGGSNVKWTASDARSQTHIVVVCQPKDPVGSLNARHIIVQRSCAPDKSELQETLRKIDRAGGIQARIH